MNHLRDLKKIFILCIALLFSLRVQAISDADKQRIDSIFNAISKMPDDTATAGYINAIYFDYLWQFNLPQSYNKLKLAARLSHQFNYTLGEYESYHNMASYCIRTNNLEIAMQDMLKQQEAALKLGDSTRIVVCLMGLGNIYNSMHMYPLALDHYFKAKSFIERSGNLDRLARLYLFLGWTYSGMKDYPTALNYATKGKDIRRKIHYWDGLLGSYISMRGINIAMKHFEQADQITDSILVMNRQLGDSLSVSDRYIEFGEVLLLQKKYKEALSFYERAFLLIKPRNDRARFSNICEKFAEVYDSLDLPLKAYPYFKNYINIRDSINAVEEKIKTDRTREIYDLESKNAEIDLLGKEKQLGEKENESKQRFIWGLSIILLITFALVAIVFRGYRQKKRSAKELQEQKQIIEEKNKNIIDSINYARRIQRSIMPTEKYISKYLNRKDK